MKHNSKRQHASKKERVSTPLFERIQPDAAGIDCGQNSHFVAVPPNRDPQPVREFRPFTADLHRLAAVTPVSECDVVLAAPPNGGIRDYTMLLDLVLLQGATVVATPAEQLPDAARAHGGTAAIVHPGTSLPAGLDLRMVTAASAG